MLDAKVYVSAGRAAEELLYTQDEMSTINQRQMVVARMIVQKLTVHAAMTDNPSIGPRTIITPVKLGAGRSGGIVSASRVSSKWQFLADTCCSWLVQILPLMVCSLCLF